MATWTALTTATDPKRQDGKVIAFLMSDVVIYKGDIVRIAADGYLTNVTPATGDMCAGIALETVDNSAGSAGDKTCLVATEGVCVVYHADAGDVSDIGTTAICAAGSGDDAQVVTSGYSSVTNACACGTIIGAWYDPVTGAEDVADSDGFYRLWIKLQTLRQIKAS